MYNGVHGSNNKVQASRDQSYYQQHLNSPTSLHQPELQGVPVKIADKYQVLISLPGSTHHQSVLSKNQLKLEEEFTYDFKLEEQVLASAL